MNLFDQLALNIFNHYKPRLKQKANGLAVFYMSFLQSSVLLVLGVFFAAFFRQMKVETMSSSKAWTLFVLATILIYFKNWMSFTGKKRNILKAKSTKSKAQSYNVWVLWLLPFGCIGLAILLLQKF